MMALPPLLDGAVKLTLALALPDVAVPMVGAPGTVDGVVTLLDATEGSPVPAAFVALTTKEYAVPFDSPKTEHGEAVQPLLVKPPGLLVAV